MLRHIFTVAALFLCLLAPAFGAKQDGDWTLYKIDGRDYVTMQNVAEFYGMSDFARTGDKTFEVRGGGRSLRGELNSKEFFINTIKFILSYEIREADGNLCLSRMDLTKLLEPVMRPAKIKGADEVNTIVLDAGHGGHDKGAWSPYGYEKTFSLDVVQRAKKLFESQGYRVVLTRSSDIFVPLYDRASIANRQKNAVFISVHFNSGGAGTGIETYSLAPRGVPSMMADGPSVSDLVMQDGNINDAQNMALTTAMHAAMVVRSRLYDRGIKRARFVVIRETKIPAVLVEGGFLSHSFDAKIIATPEYRQQLAGALVTAVGNYRRAIGQTQAVAQDVGGQPRVRINSDAVGPRSESSVPNASSRN
ncbi:MAG: N-acetylmuramoyl-L-alanine amidase [Chthoniobacteraceae bacterium]